MTNKPNFLRVIRKSSPLTLMDIAFLMKLKDNSILSRYEKSNRIPSIEFLIFYHLLFNKSIEIFYELQLESAKVLLGKQIKRFLKDKHKKNEGKMLSIKHDFLSRVLNRITSQKSDAK